MNFQRTKGIVIILIIVSLIAGTTYYLTVAYYTKTLKAKIQRDEIKSQNLQMIVVASKEIPMGTLITAENVTIASVPFNNIVDRTKVFRADQMQAIYGYVAAVNIYPQEQILSDKLISNVEFTPEDWNRLSNVALRKFDPSYRYVTVDIPKYNFVNERVGVGSLVDVLVDRGQGMYDVVLAKVAILDKIPINGSQQNDNTQNTSMQIQRPLPKPLLLRQGTQGKFASTKQELLYENNPALDESPDYRVTIMVTEKEQKRIFEAMTCGKLMLRQYVFPSQPASKITFTSVEESKVAGDGTVGLPKRTQTSNTATSTNQTVNSADSTLGLPIRAQ